MPRLPRLDVPGLPQHLRVRGNNGQACFVDDADRWVYLRLLQKGAVESGCAIHAYALMTDHVHLVATGHCKGAISEMMRDSGSRYVALFNRRHGRYGTLFEGRFRSSVIESDSYLLTCMRYAEENPVRAGIVSTPADYRWSSFVQNAGGAPAGLLRPHEVYWSLGRDARQRGAAYRALWEKPIEAATLAAIRTAAMKNRALGTPSFLDELGRSCDRRVAPRNAGRPKRGQREMCSDPI